MTTLARLRLLRIIHVSCMVAIVSAPPTAAVAATDCSQNVRRTAKRPTVVSDTATKARPVVVRYDQPAGGVFLEVQGVGSGHVVTPLRVASRYKVPRLHVRVEWPAPSPSDIDAYLYDVNGREVGKSEGWNITPVDSALGRDAGFGYEHIANAAVAPCGRYELLTTNWHSAGEKAVVKMWLTATNV